MSIIFGGRAGSELGCGHALHRRRKGQRILIGRRRRVVVTELSKGMVKLGSWRRLRAHPARRNQGDCRRQSRRCRNVLDQLPELTTKKGDAADGRQRRGWRRDVSRPALVAPAPSAANQRILPSPLVHFSEHREYDAAAFDQQSSLERGSAAHPHRLPSGHERRRAHMCVADHAFESSRQNCYKSRRSRAACLRSVRFPSPVSGFCAGQREQRRAEHHGRLKSSRSHLARGRRQPATCRVSAFEPSKVTRRRVELQALPMSMAKQSLNWQRGGRLGRPAAAHRRTPWPTSSKLGD